jgi:hypothetical protein
MHIAFPFLKQMEEDGIGQDKRHHCQEKPINKFQIVLTDPITNVADISGQKRTHVLFSTLL